MKLQLANLMFVLELDRRSRAQGWGIVSNAAHPGPTRCDVALLATRGARWDVLVQGVDQRPRPALYAAASPEAHGGRLYGPDGFGQFTGGPAKLTIYRPARDEAAATRLWEVSVRLAGVEFTAARG